jgi:hypothetical protein
VYVFQPVGRICYSLNPPDARRQTTLAATVSVGSATTCGDMSFQGGSCRESITVKQGSVPVRREDPVVQG